MKKIAINYKGISGKQAERDFNKYKKDLNKGSDSRILAYSRNTPVNNDRPRTIRKKSNKRRGHQ